MAIDRTEQIQQPRVTDNVNIHAHKEVAGASASEHRAAHERKDTGSQHLPSIDLHDSAAHNAKKEPKAGDPKAPEAKAEPDAKDLNRKAGEAKATETKSPDARSGEAKSGEAKPGEAKPGDDPGKNSASMKPSDWIRKQLDSGEKQLPSQVGKDYMAMAGQLGMAAADGLKNNLEAGGKFVKENPGKAALIAGAAAGAAFMAPELLAGAAVAGGLNSIRKGAEGLKDGSCSRMLNHNSADGAAEHNRLVAECGGDINKVIGGAAGTYGGIKAFEGLAKGASAAENAADSAMGGVKGPAQALKDLASIPGKIKSGSKPLKLANEALGGPHPVGAGGADDSRDGEQKFVGP